MGTILEGMRAKIEEEINEPEEIIEPKEEEIVEPVEPVEEEPIDEPAAELDADGNPVEPAAYEPNHKFTFKDQEFEFDDKTKSFIKTKEDEDFFRDMVTAQKAQEAYKGFGSLRDIETKMGQFDSLTETQTKYKELDTELDQLGGMLKQGNIEQFRQHLGIPKEQLLDWAIKEAKSQEDPAFAQQLQADYNQQQQNFNLQYQNNMLHNNMEQQQVEERTTQLDTGLENSEVAKKYDDLVGTPGSFRQAVIDHGINNFNTTGRDISVAEALVAVTQKYQGLVSSEVVGTQPNPNTQQIEPGVVAPVKANPANTVVINQGGKQTIPNIQGGSGTPAKKQFKSLSAIRAHAKTL